METLISGSNISTVLTDEADRSTVNGTSNALVAGAGSDSVMFEGDRGTLYGGYFRYVSDDITVNGADNDEFFIKGDINLVLTDGGNDSITVEGANNLVHTGAGVDYVTVNGDDNFLNVQANGTIEGAGDDNLSMLKNAGLIDLVGNRNALNSTSNDSTLRATGNGNVIYGGGLIQASGDDATLVASDGATIETEDLIEGIIGIADSTASFEFNGRSITVNQSADLNASLMVENDSIVAGAGFDSDATVAGLSNATLEISSELTADGIRYSLNGGVEGYSDDLISLHGGAVYGLDFMERMTIDKAGVYTVNGSELTISGADDVIRGLTDWAGIAKSNTIDNILVSGTDGNDWLSNIGENATLNLGKGVDYALLLSSTRENILLNDGETVMADAFDTGFETNSDAVMFNSGAMALLSVDFDDEGVIFDMYGGGQFQLQELPEDSVDINIYINNELHKVTAIDDNSTVAFDGNADNYMLGANSVLTGVTGTAVINNETISTNGTATVAGYGSIVGLNVGDTISITDNNGTRNYTVSSADENIHTTDYLATRANDLRTVFDNWLNSGVTFGDDAFTLDADALLENAPFNEISTFAADFETMAGSGGLRALGADIEAYYKGEASFIGDELSGLIDEISDNEGSRLVAESVLADYHDRVKTANRITIKRNGTVGNIILGNINDTAETLEGNGTIFAGAGDTIVPTDGNLIVFAEGTSTIDDNPIFLGGHQQQVLLTDGSAVKATIQGFEVGWLDEETIQTDVLRADDISALSFDMTDDGVIAKYGDSELLLAVDDGLALNDGLTPIGPYQEAFYVSDGAGKYKAQMNMPNENIVVNVYSEVHYVQGGSNQISIESGNNTIYGATANDTILIDGDYTSILSEGVLMLSVDTVSAVFDGVGLLGSVNINGDTVAVEDTSTVDSDTMIAAGLVEYAMHKTELGYPSLAADFFHPTVTEGEPPTLYTSSETWTIQSTDGLTLNAIHYAAPVNTHNKWAILVHGYGGEHNKMQAFVDKYLAVGYDVLSIDQRTAGESGGEWVTFGGAEAEDVALWTQEIARRVPTSKITLHGVSMGAATVMLAAARSDCANLMAVVEDCGYASVYDLMSQLVPVLTPYTADVMPAFNAMASVMTGHALTEATPLDAIDDVTVPSMFIHGMADSVISPLNAVSLMSASGADVKALYTVEGAGHGVSGFVDSVGYASNLFQFLDNNDGTGIIYNYIADNSMAGTGGNDTIISLGTRGTLNGGAGNDLITLGGVSWTVDAADSLQTTGNNALVNAGDGDDSIYSRHSYWTTLNGGSGNDYIVVTDGHYMVIDGGAGDDSIVGTTLSGHWAIGGHAIISGGDGNDYIAPAYANDASINGGAGDDTIIVAADAPNVTVNTGGGVDIVDAGGYRYTVTGDADGVQIIGNSVTGADANATVTMADKGEYFVNGTRYTFDVANGFVRFTELLQGDTWTLRGSNWLFYEEEYGTVIAGDERTFIDTESASLSVAMGTHTTLRTHAGADILSYDPNTRSGFVVGDDVAFVDGSISVGADNVIRGLSDNSARIFDGNGESLTAWTGSDGLLDRSSADGREMLIANVDNSTVISSSRNDTINAIADNVKVRYGDGRDVLLGDAVIYQDVYYDKQVRFTDDGLKFFDNRNSLLLKDVNTSTNVTWHFGDETVNALYVADGDDYSVEALADQYIGMTRNTGVDFSNIDDIYIYNLAKIGRVTLGGGNSTFEGSNIKQTITAGAGDDVIELSKGRDIIQNFDADNDSLVANGDFDVKVKGADLLVKGANGEQALLVDLATVDSAIKIDDKLVKAGAAMSFDDAVTDYVGAQNATLTVGDDANIWLGGFDGKNYSNIKTVDASDNDGDVLIAGTSAKEILIGGYGSNSLWGGGGFDTMIGGAGSNEFFYAKGDGRDVIENAHADDVVELLNISLDDIKSIDADSASVTMKFNDGGRLNINSSAELTYNIEGSAYTVDRNNKALQRK